MRLALIALSFIGLSFMSCTNTNKAKNSDKKRYKYICTMHPQIGADKPGTCSKCGMDLVKRDTTNDN